MNDKPDLKLTEQEPPQDFEMVRVVLEANKKAGTLSTLEYESALDALNKYATFNVVILINKQLKNIRSNILAIETAQRMINEHLEAFDA